MEKKTPLPVVTFRARPEFVKVLTEAAAKRRLSRSELIRLSIEREVRGGRKTK